MLGNSQQTNPGKGLMDIPVQIKKAVLLHQALHSTIFTFPVMSHEEGKEQQEAKSKFLEYHNDVITIIDLLSWILKKFSMLIWILIK